MSQADQHKRSARSHAGRRCWAGTRRARGTVAGRGGTPDGGLGRVSGARGPGVCDERRCTSHAHSSPLPPAVARAWGHASPRGHAPPRLVQGGRGLRSAGRGRSGSGRGAPVPWTVAGTHLTLEKRAPGLRADVPVNAAAETSARPENAAFP